jgi:hypothetical protein
MKRRTAVAAISSISLLVAALGCEVFTGGGWIVSPGDSAKKATFGLQLKCTEGDFDLDADDPDARVSGDFTFHDHGTLVPDEKSKLKQLAFKANFGELVQLVFPDGFVEDSSCDDLDQAFIDEFAFDGYVAIYNPQPAALGEPGLLLLHVEDNGKQGPDKGDFLYVTLIDGAFNGYSAAGEIQGGQITLHQD